MKRMILAFAVMAGLCLSAKGAEAQDEWKAGWIAKEQCNSTPNTWLRLRKMVSIDRVPAKLEARIAADTKYWLWVNGEMAVFEGGLKRGPAPGDGYYDVVDIAPYLREGENNISVLLWHFGKSGFSHMGSGLAGFLFEAAGDGIEILSDRSWEGGVFPAYQTVPGSNPNYRLPESSIRFDARAGDFDWFKEKKGNLGAMMETGIQPGMPPMGRLVKRPIPMWKDFGFAAYESVTRRGDTLVCKLPLNCQVTPYLKVNAPAGRVIRMQTDHAVVTGCECLTAEYVTREGVQEYESLGWLNGEEMYYIVPEGVEVLDLKYRRTGYDCEISGYFHCDDPLLNDYWQRAANTMLVCMRDTYYDCPDRERAQWWGDEVDELGEAFYALSPSSHLLARKGILELAAWQQRDGSMFSPVPASNWYRELPFQILASVGWYGFRQQAFYDDDYTFVPEVYDAVHKYLHETWKLDRDGMPIYRNGGWDWPDAGDNSDKYAALPCWYALALMGEREFAGILGKDADVAEDNALIDNIKEQFNRRYWTGEKYRSSDYEGFDDDRVQALAVLAGFADESKYPALLEMLRKEMHATTFMHRFVLEALFMMNAPEVALSRMRAQYPTIMADGCSTLYEHWNFEGTCNHAWAGSGIIALGERVAGIRPLTPGFKTFILDPRMGDLKEVDAKVDTHYGLIEVSLRSKGRRIEAVLTVPEGTSASVPAAKGKVKEFGPGTHTITLIP